MIKLKAGIKAASKADAYNMVKRLCAGEELAEHEQHSLLLFFAPNTKPKKDAFAWVASFVCTDKHDHRGGIHYVYSNGERICATNGHALAWAPSTLPAGYYHPKTGDSVACDYIYPDVDRVIPPEFSDGTDICLGDCETIQTESKDCPIVRMVPCKAADGTAELVPFDGRYIAKAIAGGNARITYMKDSKSPVRGNTEMGGFVVMPRRM